MSRLGKQIVDGLHDYLKKLKKEGMPMIELGRKVRDKITGFEGVATSRVEYLTGCTQIGVAPKVDNEGKIRDTQYFDFGRLEYVDASTISLEEAKANPGGPNRDCPR